MKRPSPRRELLNSFFLIWLGQAISLLGSQLVQFSLIWWLTQTTGSATMLAAATLVGLLPQIVLGPFVGVLVDRWNRRLTLLLADGLVALATAVLALLFWLGVTQIWHVFLILFLRSLAGAFHWPAMQASMSLMVPADKLTRVQGLNQMLNGGLNIASAPLAAVLLAVLPLPAILGIDVATALIAILPLLFIAIPQPEETAESALGFAAFTADLRAGLRYVRAWPGLMMVIALATLINLVLAPTSALMPLLVTDHFQGGALQLGWMESAFGLGIVGGGLLLGAWGGFQRRIFTSLIGVMGLGLNVLAIGLAPPDYFNVAVAGMLGMGIMSSLTNGPIMAIIQSVVAPAMQGRVLTLLNSAAMAMMPIGLLLAGPGADWLGINSWYVIGGTVTILIGIVGFLSPALLTIEEERTAVLQEGVVETAVLP